MMIFFFNIYLRCKNFQCSIGIRLLVRERYVNICYRRQVCNIYEHEHDQLQLQVNTTTPAGLTPLMLACLREDVAVVKKITIAKPIICHIIIVIPTSSFIHHI